MRFAHFADIHLGFQKEEPLQKIERHIFEDAMDRCIDEDVDFILLCGDIFHVNIPDMGIQKMAMTKFRDIHEKRIPVYAVYGSHDFSPTGSSAIDLLEAAGYLIKVTVPSYDDDRIRLDYIRDEKTGARLAGLPGLKAGRDTEYYERLDREYLESVEGFRIFMFHGAVGELIQDEISDGSIPISYMPKGLDYYAGGHIHTFRHRNISGYCNAVYPGTIFAGYHTDMEESARGKRRGFAMVDFEEKVERVQLVEMAPAYRYEMVEVDADGQAAEKVAAQISHMIDSVDPDGKIVILKVYGELGSGRTTDIDFPALKKRMLQDGAYHTMINRSGLSSKEYRIRRGSAGTREEIERHTFRENIGEVRTKRANLVGSKGVALSESLLATFRHHIPDNEKKIDYERRVTGEAASKMELE